MIFQFGNITLFIDNPYFCRGFMCGRELYARDCRFVPTRRIRLTISEVMRYVAVPDGNSGHWHFDTQTLGQAEEYLGVSLVIWVEHCRVQIKPLDELEAYVFYAGFVTRCERAREVPDRY